VLAGGALLTVRDVVPAGVDDGAAGADVVGAGAGVDGAGAGVDGAGAGVDEAPPLEGEGTGVKPQPVAARVTLPP
jgi:hypothetical protein